MKSKNWLIGLSFFACVVILSSCAPAGHSTKEYGFFSGILHGFLFIFALIGKLFGGDHGLHATHNTGFFYWLGYLIGICLIWGGGSAARR